MKKIKDFFYNFSDILFAILVVVGIIYVLYYNVDYITHLDYKTTDKETVQESETEEEIVDVNVTIPNNINLEQLADILSEYKIIDDKTKFIESFENKDVKIKSGDFKLNEKMDFNQIKDVIIEK